jgi:hypothetical protein
LVGERGWETLAAADGPGERLAGPAERGEKVNAGLPPPKPGDKRAGPVRAERAGPGDEKKDLPEGVVDGKGAVFGTLGERLLRESVEGALKMVILDVLLRLLAGSAP